MSFIVETGTGIKLANSYETVAGFQAYHADHGNDVSAYSSAAIQAALVEATAYIDGRWGAQLKGEREWASLRSRSVLTLSDVPAEGETVTFGNFVYEFGSGSEALAEALNDALVAAWGLNEDGGTREDSSGNGFNLAEVNTVPRVAGKIGFAANFTELNSEYLEAASADVLSFSGAEPFSFCGWVKLAVKVNSYAIVSKWNADTGDPKRQYAFVYDSSADRFKFWVSDDGVNVAEVTATSFGSPTAGVWYFFHVEHTGAEIRISINNGGHDETAHATGVFASASRFRLGALRGGSGEEAFQLSGDIDAVVSFDRALTASEVAYLYNSGTGREGPFTSIPVEIGVDEIETLTNLAAEMAETDTEDFTGTAFADPDIAALTIYGARDGITSTEALANGAFDGATTAGLSRKPQPLEFPRVRVYDDARQLVTGIPAKLRAATSEYALRALTATLSPDPTVDASGRIVTGARTKVGPIETETRFAETGPVTITKAYPEADRLLREYVRRSGVIRA